MYRKYRLLTGCALLACACSDPASGPLTVTSPTPGEALIAGTEVTIAWTGDGAQDVVDIYLVDDQGTRLDISLGEANDGEYVWSVPLLTDFRTRPATLVVTPPGTEPSALVSGERLAENRNATSTAIEVGAFAAFRWNDADAQLEYYWIDPATGDSTVIQQLGDYYTEAHWAAVDRTGGQLYVLAVGNGDDTQYLFAIDTITGTIGGSPQVAAPGELRLTAPVVLSDGSLVAFRPTSDFLNIEMVAVDPATGAVATLGQVGGLENWDYDSTVDPASNTVYVSGAPPSPGAYEGTIYSMDGTVGTLLGESTVQISGLPTGIPHGLVHYQGSDLRAVLNSGPDTFKLLAIDGSTGVSTELAPFTDMDNWDGTARLNGTTDEFLIFGWQADTAYLYAFAASDGAYLYRRTIVDPTDALLVYTDFTP